MVSWLRPSTKLITASSADCKAAQIGGVFLRYLRSFSLSRVDWDRGKSWFSGCTKLASDALHPTTEMNISAQLTIKMVSTGKFDMSYVSLHRHSLMVELSMVKASDGSLAQFMQPHFPPAVGRDCLFLLVLLISSKLKMQTS
jgi:hypothetical protein